MAKNKKRLMTRPATKVEHVVMLCRRKSGCTLAQIQRTLGVSAEAAHTLIAGARAKGFNVKRQQHWNGSSVYSL